MMARRSLPAACALLALAFAAACSTSPKSKGVVFDTRNQAVEYAKLADGFFSRGEYDSAVQFYHQALDGNSRVDNVEGVARTRASLGRVYLASGDAERAAIEFDEALIYAQISEVRAAIALAKAGLGELAYVKGEHETALALFEEAIVLAADDAGVLAVALHDSATAQAALGRVPEAKANLERAQAINIKIKHWAELAANRYVLASILAKEGTLEQALAMVLSALEADRNAENGKGLASDLAAAASISRRLGKPQAAYAYWRRSFDTALASNDAGAVRKALGALIELAGELAIDKDVSKWAALLSKLDEAETKK